MIKKLKNTSGADAVWRGQTIANTAYFEVPEEEQYQWVYDSGIHSDITSGDLTVNDGSSDLAATPGLAYWKATNTDCVKETEVNNAAKADNKLLGYNSANSELEYKTVDKAFVGLSNADNTSDADKPVSTAQQTALDTKVDDSEKGAANGIPTLDGSSKIPSSQLPGIAITSTFVAANEAAQLALTVDEGDIAVRTDENKSYAALNSDNVDMGDWQELITPTDSVLSVNSQTGTVSLDSDDISEGTTNKYYPSADSSKLAAIEASATADQTGAEIKSAYEAEADTNAFTDADHSKLDGIAASATANDTDANLKARANHTGTQTMSTISDAGTAATKNVPAAGDAAAGEVVKGDDSRLSDARTPSSHTHSLADITDEGTLASKSSIATADIDADAVTYAKIQNVSATDRLMGRNTAGAGDMEELTPATVRTMLNVEDGATTDQSDAEIKTAYENNANTNAFTDADESKLDGIAASATANDTDANLKARANHTGTQTLSTISDAGTAASKNVPASGDASSSEVVQGDDSRLTDNRTANGLKSATTTISVSAATAPTSGQVLKATSGTAATWQDENTGSDTVVEALAFGAHNAADLNATADTYDTKRYHNFRGSSDVGTPTSIEAVIRVVGGTAGKIRIYDLTNSATIVEKTGVSNTSYSVTDLGTISNISSGSAVWEIQIAGDGTNAMYIGSLSIKY